MSGEAPEWAIERAKQLRDEGYATGDNSYTLVFARYIAKHEKPPVDPLLIEARRIVADWREPSSDSVNVRIGNHDSRSDVQQALVALRRGIEIAKGGEA